MRINAFEPRRKASSGLAERALSKKESKLPLWFCPSNKSIIGYADTSGQLIPGHIFSGGLPAVNSPLGIIEAQLENILQETFPQTDKDKFNGIKIEHPKIKEHGDYSLAAFPLAKTLRQAPPQIALKIAEAAKKNDRINSFFDVSVIGGFVNFKMHSDYLLSSLSLITPLFGRNNKLAGKKIMVEFVSANPTGPLHIGHGRWAVLGDSICRLFDACGAQVVREFYVNDAGGQIARFIISIEAAKTGQPIPEDGYKGNYIYDLAKKEGDPVQLMIQQQRETLSALGVNFDVWFSEKDLHKENKIEAAIKILTQAGLTYKAKGKELLEGEPNTEADKEEGEALWFKSTNFGDEKDRVLVRANGEPTYFAGDVAYHLNKIERGFDFLLTILGADHHGYKARLSAVIRALSEDKQEHQIIIGQLVKLLREGTEVRMSKRKGTAIMLHDLIEEIGADAVRVFMGSTGFDTSLSIDLDVATSEESKNPVYYLQYAHARISQIIQKAAEQELIAPTTLAPDYSLLPEERNLLAHLLYFPEIVSESAESRNVHRLFQYTMDIAALFHSFYKQCRVLDDAGGTRLAIVKAVQQVLKNAFALLGISAPEKMEKREELSSL